MMIQTKSVVLILLLLAGNTYASDVRQWIREGNKFFEEGRYAEAEAKYRQSLDEEGDNFKALFNLGNALYMQGRLDEAQEVFDALSYGAPSDEGRASALHNLGNAYLGAGQIPKSIEAYKRALRLMPDEEDTRYNLAYALKLLDEMPPEGEPQQDDADDRDEGDESQDPGAQEKEGDDEKDDGPHDDKRPPAAEEDISPERIDQLTQEDAERILEALKQQEQKIQEEINRENRTRERVRTEREW